MKTIDAISRARMQTAARAVGKDVRNQNRMKTHPLLIVPPEKRR